MGISLSLIAAAVLELAGCPAGSTRGGEGSASIGDSTPGSDSSMTPFEQALSSFRKTAASRLQQPGDQVQVLPGSEDVVGFDDLATGELIAFAGTAGQTTLRGLAAPSGEVVLVWQDTIEHLDTLLQAAHALDPAQSLAALDLARRIVWLHGVSYTLIATPADWKASAQVPPQVTEPVIERADDGAVTLRFFMNQAGDMGVILAYEAVVTAQPDQPATWTVERVAH